MSRYATIYLDGTFRETESLSRFPASNTSLRHDELLAVSHSLTQNKNVRNVFIIVGQRFQVSSIAEASPIAEVLRALVSAGKRLEFVATAYREVELYLASFCQSRSIHPLGSVALTGIGRDFLFFRRTLDHLRLTVEVARRRQYKGGADALVREDLDPIQDEQYRNYYRDIATTVEAAIRRGYAKTESDLSRLRREAVSAEEAVASGWADRVATWDDIRAELKDQKIRPHKHPRYRGRYGHGKKIVVLVLEGLISGGTNRRNPVLGQSVGSASFVAQVRKLRSDRSVAAVVLRVHSRGGTATAAEDIRRELARLAEEKPLFTSLGPVAASGGYWVACLGKPVFVEETSLVGSIGVIVLFLRAAGLLSKLGLRSARVDGATSDNRLSAFRSSDGRSRRVLEAMIEPVYRRFTALVADSRKIEADRVEELAGGRIFGGAAGVENGLADSVGGLSEAIEAARAAIGASRVRVEFRPRVHRSLLQRIIGRNVPSVSALEGMADVHADVSTIEGMPLALFF